MAEVKEKNHELIIGLVIAVFAAVMAICDLGAGKYGDDEMIANQKQTEAFNWYQSKSIKQTLAEGQRDMLQALVKTNAIETRAIAGVDSFINELNQNVKRYKKEKDEILRGSEAVGKENWVQDVEGVMGKVKGANEWKSEAAKLGDAGDVFDKATLFLQMCLVLGAIALLIGSDKLKILFLYATIIVGALGSYYTIVAYAMV